MTIEELQKEIRAVCEALEDVLIQTTETEISPEDLKNSKLDLTLILHGIKLLAKHTHYPHPEFTFKD